MPVVVSVVDAYETSVKPKVFTQAVIKLLSCVPVVVSVVDANETSLKPMLIIIITIIIITTIIIMIILNNLSHLPILVLC